MKFKLIQSFFLTSLLVSTQSAQFVLMDPLLKCVTQFVTLDSKISQSTPELDFIGFQNLPTSYVLESINASGQSNMVTSFGFSFLTQAVHSVYTKYVVCSTYLYFSDSILKHKAVGRHHIHARHISSLECESHILSVHH